MAINQNIHDLLDNCSMRSRAKYLEQALKSKQSDLTVGEYLLSLRLNGKDDEADYWQEGLAPAVVEVPTRPDCAITNWVSAELSGDSEQMWKISGMKYIHKSVEDMIALVRYNGCNGTADAMQMAYEMYGDPRESK
jgi:hypothetical protein